MVGGAFAIAGRWAHAGWGELVASEDYGGVGLGVLFGFYMGRYASVGYVFVDIDGVGVAFVKDGVPHDAALLGGAWRERERKGGGDVN